LQNAGVELPPEMNMNVISEDHAEKAAVDAVETKVSSFFVFCLPP
jgi:hypothetical protein